MVQNLDGNGVEAAPVRGLLVLIRNRDADHLLRVLRSVAVVQKRGGKGVEAALVHVLPVLIKRKQHICDQDANHLLRPKKTRLLRNDLDVPGLGENHIDGMPAPDQNRPIFPFYCIIFNPENLEQSVSDGKLHLTANE